ncbi:MAG: HD domain-containing protein [Candidatus Omnitrophica bacterium]|nr:HD domain-containing protein [Candidatus Omnitrophota bacterium]
MNLLAEYPVLKTLQALAKKRRLQVHLVGGCLRDYLLKRPLNDLDFAVDRRPLVLAEAFAREIHGKYILLDEDHQCARVAKKTGGRLFTYDFAGYRGEDLAADLGLRDFTINTLAVDLNALTEGDDLEDQIIDVNRARKDIADRRIKRTSIRSLTDDPLRMMRAFSLKANLGFKIELKTLNQIRKEKDRIRDVSPERVREEFFKVLESSKTAEILKAMDRVGLLERVIPQVRVMFECRQGGYHHLDVWPHSLEVVRQLDILIAKVDNPELQVYLDETVGGGHTRRALIKLAGLLHDIGKPDTRKRVGERLTFHGHEHVGRRIATAVCRMLKLSTHERHSVEDMVQWHMRPGYISNYKRPSPRMLYRYFRDTDEEAAAIALLSWADQRSTRGPLTTEDDQRHHEAICLQLIEEFLHKQKEEPYVPLVNGHDIMKALKMTGSPLVGEILAQIQERHSLGKIKTKTEAIALAKKIAKDAA